MSLKILPARIASPHKRKPPAWSEASNFMGEICELTRTDAEFEHWPWGAIETMLHERNCAEQSCGRASVASLSQRDLCLEHFLFSCYENLERLDPRAAASALTPSTWLPCELSSKSVPARRSTSVSIPRILIISNAAAFWISCSGPVNSFFSC